MKIDLSELIEARDALKELVAACNKINGADYLPLVKPSAKASMAAGMLNFYIKEATKGVQVEVQQ